VDNVWDRWKRGSPVSLVACLLFCQTRREQGHESIQGRKASDRRGGIHTSKKEAEDYDSVEIRRSVGALALAGSEKVGALALAASATVATASCALFSNESHTEVLVAPIDVLV
jgi:hypothetical protein